VAYFFGPTLYCKQVDAAPGETTLRALVRDANIMAILQLASYDD